MAWNYTTEITTDSPFIWYRMDEISGTTANDNGSSAQNGTFAGTAGEYVLDQNPVAQNGGGRAVDFNIDGVAADDGRIELNPVSSFPTTDTAYEIWFEEPAGSPSGQFLASYAVGGQAREFSLEVQSNSQIRLYVKGTAVSMTLVSASNNVDDGRVHHLYVDWRSSDGRVRCFLDGVRHYQSVGTQTGMSLTAAGTLMVGQDQSAPGTPGAASAAWEGRLDQFALYSSNLTEERVAIHASAGLTRYIDYEEFSFDDIEFFEPSAPFAAYRNRVYDSNVPGFVRWDTAEPDSSGTAYPGPGTFGVDTSDYTVELIT